MARKISKLRITIPKEPPTINVPEELPKLHGLHLFSAVRGSGKSCSMSFLVRKYREMDLAHKVMLLCPTWLSNKYLWEGVVDSDEDVFLEPSHDSVRRILKKMEGLAEEWRNWKRHMELYELVQRELRSKKSLSKLDEALLMEALEAGVLEAEEPPTYWAGRAEHPIMHLVIDDCQGTQIYQPSSRNPLLHLAILHRHAFERCGVTLWFATQNFTGQAAGIPRSIRLNCTMICLWGIRDLGMLDRILEEFGGEVATETFQAMYEYATCGSKHDFICCEFAINRFRKNFDEILDPAAFAAAKKKPAGESSDDGDQDTSAALAPDHR